MDLALGLPHSLAFGAPAVLAGTAAGWALERAVGVLVRKSASLRGTSHSVKANNFVRGLCNRG